MKKLLALTFLCMVTSLAVAKSIVFTLNDGTLVYYLLGGETNPKMRFVDGKMTIDADTYEISDIKNFYISSTDDPNGIESTLADKGIKYGENTVVIGSANAKAVKVFSLNGSVVETDIQQSGQSVSVSLEGLEKGAYVVKVGSTSFKILKK